MQTWQHLCYTKGNAASSFPTCTCRMCWRQEQLAQLILLGIARATSQATRGLAELSEIAVCGKEIREAHSLVFTQHPMWACKCEGAQSSYIASVKI